MSKTGKVNALLDSVPAAGFAFRKKFEETYGRLQDTEGRRIMPFRAIQAALEAVRYDALVEERDRLRDFLSAALIDAMHGLDEFNWTEVEHFLRRSEIVEK